VAAVVARNLRLSETEPAEGEERTSRKDERAKKAKRIWIQHEMLVKERVSETTLTKQKQEVLGAVLMGVWVLWIVVVRALVYQSQQRRDPKKDGVRGALMTMMRTRKTEQKREMLLGPEKLVGV